MKIFELIKKSSKAIMLTSILLGSVVRADDGIRILEAKLHLFGQTEPKDVTNALQRQCEARLNQSKSLCGEYCNRNCELNIVRSFPQAYKGWLPLLKGRYLCQNGREGTFETSSNLIINCSIASDFNQVSTLSSFAHGLSSWWQASANDGLQNHPVTEPLLKKIQ